MTKEKVEIKFYKNGHSVAEILFDADLNEILREDPQILLSDITAETLMA